MKGLFKQLWLVMGFCALTAVALPADAVTVTIDGSQTNQVIDGFGANINYLSWTNDELKPVLDALIDQGGMTLFRVVFDNADWEGTNDNNDSNVMDWNYYNAVYSSPRFEKLWSLVAYLNQKGITNGIVFNFQGQGPSWMGGSTLTPGYEDEWAEMIASLLYYARNTRHLQFNLVAPDNEPDNIPQGIGVSGSAQYVTMLHDLAQKLDTNGMSDVRFVAPDLSATDTGFISAMMNDSVVMAKLAHFGAHSYSSGGVGSAGLYNFIQQSAYPDRTFWMTEFNVWCDACEAGQYGTYDWSYCRGTAEYLLSDLANGSSAGLVWEGYDSVFVILGTRWSLWGLFGVDDTNAVTKTYTARKDFYTLSQISKFVRPGAQQISLSDNFTPFDQLLAFYNPGNGQLTLTGINTSGGAAILSGNLTSLPAVPSLEFYYTDADTNLSHSASVPINNGSFTVSVPGDCVFTLTGFNPNLPSVSVLITNPVNGAQFTAPATIPIQATAATTLGGISTVDFFAGATNLGESTIAPYGMTWSNVSPGAYVLTANATNSTGYAGVSPGVQISVVGPVAQITVTPANALVVPYGTQQFTAIAADALGTVLNSQPVFGWSVDGGGTIDANGLFTAGGGAGGPFTITAGNNSVTGTASLAIASNVNIAPSGTGYTWYGLTIATGNTPQATASGINDGDLNTDVPLQPGGAEENSRAYEAAGVVWNIPQTITGVTYINGSYNQYHDGVFAGSFGLQFSPDGTTWTNAGPEWSVAPAYVYNSAASADVSFAFTGGLVTASGVRCVGRVHTSGSGLNSWVAFATEVRAFSGAATPPLLEASVDTNGVTISWSRSVTNFLLETATNLTPPAAWSSVTNTPQTVGNEQQVVITPVGNHQFFRLQHQ